MSKKHIVVIGLGGVGGYFGFKINKFNEVSQKYHISFVVRNQAFHAINKRGLILHSVELGEVITKPDSVIENISDIIKPDLILICVKAYDLEDVCRQLNEVITPHTILLPLMNGADIYDRIRKVIPRHTILPSCVYISAHIKDKGIVEHKSMPGKIIFGRDNANLDTPIDWIIELLEKSRIDLDLQENPQKAIWTKFLFIASFGLVTTKHNSSFGKVCSDPIQKQEATDIMNEIKAIAHAKGIVLDENVVENTFKIASSFPFETPSSIQLDIHGKKGVSELDILGGSILRLGKEHAIATPCAKIIFNEINQMIESNIKNSAI
ncbi:MAG: 2-dehydropantoate 2-reductase [Cyclobacteriaceae bacterium]|nr:2-dehydropantoate 2-reductase [Cyclobacteriaceae bacterium]